MHCICKWHSILIPYTSNWMSCFQNTIIRQLNWSSFLFLECSDVFPMYGFAKNLLGCDPGSWRPEASNESFRLQLPYGRNNITVPWIVNSIESVKDDKIETARTRNAQLCRSLEIKRYCHRQYCLLQWNFFYPLFYSVPLFFLLLSPDSRTWPQIKAKNNQTWFH